MAEKDPKDNERDDQEENVNKSEEEEDEDFGLPGLEDDEDENAGDSEESESTDEAGGEETESSDEGADESEEQDAGDESEWNDAPVKSKSDYISSSTIASEYERPPRKGFPTVTVIVLATILVVTLGVLYVLFGEELGLKSSDEGKTTMVVEDTTKKAMDTTALQQDTSMVEKEPKIEKDTASWEILTERTGRYYVIVASFLDDDLAADYARRLQRQGTSSKILSPRKDKGFYRFSVANFDSLSKAEARAEELKSEYSSEVWVVKY